MKINYHNRTFAGISNTPNGQVSGDTLFAYRQNGDMLLASYSGGSIKTGQMTGRVNDDNSLYFVYQHIDTAGRLMSGFCHSTPEVLPDGRIRLHERWEWTHGGEGRGESIVEETAAVFS